MSKPMARDDLPNEIGRAIIAQTDRYDGEADAIMPIIERRINQALEWAADKCREEARFQHEIAGRYTVGSPRREVYRHAAIRVSEVEKVIRLAISEGGQEVKDEPAMHDSGGEVRVELDDGAEKSTAERLREAYRDGGVTLGG